MRCRFLLLLLAIILTIPDARAESFFLPLANGTELFVDQEIPRAENAPTFVLLHGLGCDGTTFQAMLPFLREKGAGIVRIDLLGHGRTLERNVARGRPGREISLTSQADAIEEALLRLKLPGFTLLGHSYGGALALALGQKQALRNQIKGIYLLAPYVYRRDHVLAHQKFPLANWDLLVRGIYPPLPSDLVYDSYVIPEFRKFFEGVYRNRWQLGEGGLSPEQAARLSLFVDGATAVTVGARDFYAARALESKMISVPLHLAVGEKDSLMPIEAERALRRVAQGAGLRLGYEEYSAGHMLEEEKPAEIAASLLRFTAALP